MSFGMFSLDESDKNVISIIVRELFGLITSSFTPDKSMEAVITESMDEYDIDRQMVLKYQIIGEEPPDLEKLAEIKKEILKYLAGQKEWIVEKYKQSKKKKKKEDVGEFIKLLAEGVGKEGIGLPYTEGSIAPSAIDCPLPYDIEALDGGKAIEIKIDNKHLRKAKGSTLPIKQFCPLDRTGSIVNVDGRIIASCHQSEIDEEEED